MWVGIFLSALNVAMGFVFRSIIAKFFMFFAIFFFATQAIGYLVSANVLPNILSMNNLFSTITASVWWGLDLCAFDVGFPAILSAYTIRFMIRRIPIIG